MPLLRSSAAGFAALALEGSLAVRVAEQMSHASGRRAGASEVRSWERSLPVLAQDLVQAGLDDVEVLVEHQLPLSSRRIDVVLAGLHPRTRRPSYVVVELKQWSSASTYEGEPTLVSVEAYGGRPVLHPSVQVQGYVDYLRGFSRALHDDGSHLVGAAYLHNAVDESRISTLRDLPSAAGSLFTAARRDDWLRFLTSRLASDARGSAAADALLSSGTAPSTQLLAVAAEEVQQRERFVLLDEQRVAFELVLHEVDKARRADGKSVVLVTGGPGSGKSVIALSLLGELARRGTTVLHATGSRSFTQTLRKVAGARSTTTQSLFTYFNSFMTAEPNSLEVLLADEAHRIRETSVSRWTRKEVRSSARAQVDELISVARVPVFLLDEHQVVRPGELGTVADIEEHAAARGLPVHRVDLDTQFRCGGSEAYVQWVLRLLGLEPGGPVRWQHDDEAFTARTAAGPQELEEWLSARAAEGFGARMTAGYCWPWSDPRPDGTLVPDVAIGDWSRPWNLKGERAVGGAPPASLWATADGGFGQVGCVYTAQGFEYDWNGVILGPDLVRRDDRWVAVRSANRDPDFRSRAKVDDLEFERLVRNVYKLLLTRGMVGTVVTSVDPETQTYLETLVDQPALTEA